MNEKNDLVPVEEKQLRKVAPNEVSVFNAELIDNVWKLATKIASSTLVPDHYQNNVPNTFLAIIKAERFGMDFHSFMEISYVYKGKFGYEGKFIIARLNTSGKFKGPIRWRAEGETKYEKKIAKVKITDKQAPGGFKYIDKERLFVSIESTRRWTAYATLKDSGETVEQTFMLKTAIMNGWTEEPTSKWNTMTEEMGQYRSATFLGRMYAPEVIQGMRACEELEEVSDAEFIDQREVAREIFEKNTEISVEPDPIVDPTKEAAAPVLSQAEVPAPPAEPEQTRGESAEPNDSHPPAAVSLSDEPPRDVGEFREWFLRIFVNDTQEVEVFLCKKRWLGMGGAITDITEEQFKAIREQWVRFKTSFEAFKKAREAA